MTNHTPPPSQDQDLRTALRSPLYGALCGAKSLEISQLPAFLDTLLGDGGPIALALTPAQAPDKAAEREGLETWGIEDTGDAIWVGPMRPDACKIDRVVYFKDDLDLHRPEYVARVKADARLICDSVNRSLAPQPNGTEASRGVGAEIRRFAQAILHGDDEHRGWLTEAAEAFISGAQMPPARGKGTATPTPPLSPDSTGPAGDDWARLRAAAVLILGSYDRPEALNAALKGLEAAVRATPLRFEPEEAQETFARLSQELGVTGTANVFRESLRLAKEAAAHARMMATPGAKAQLRENARLMREQKAAALTPSAPIAAPVRDDGARADMWKGRLERVFFDAGGFHGQIVEYAARTALPVVLWACDATNLSAREALAAIEFAQTMDDQGEMREFLERWSAGDTSEWPEFAAFLASLPTPASDVPGEAQTQEGGR